MGMQTPINFTALPPAVTGAEIPAATVCARPDISGANYYTRIDVAAAAAATTSSDGVVDAAVASCGGGSAATVTGCVGSNENAHWNIEC